MFWRFISQGFKVDYVLMDSWFTCEAFIDAVRRVKTQNLHLIGMYKFCKTRFDYSDQQLTHKQIPGFGKCQANDFDSQIADTTITMIQHFLLTLRYRFDHYESKGALFKDIEEDIIQYRLSERLWALFIELVRIIDILYDEIDSMDIFQSWKDYLKSV